MSAQLGFLDHPELVNPGALGQRSLIQPRARTSDPRTSHAAAASMHATAPHHRARIVAP